MGRDAKSPTEEKRLRPLSDKKSPCASILFGGNFVTCSVSHSVAWYLIEQRHQQKRRLDAYFIHGKGSS